MSMAAPADSSSTVAPQYKLRYVPVALLIAVAMNGTSTANVADPSCMYDIKALPPRGTPFHDAHNGQ